MSDPSIKEHAYPLRGTTHEEHAATTLSQNGKRPTIKRLLLGIFFSAMISLIAYRRRSLSRSGIAGAMLAGTTTFGLAGWSWGLSLIFFFVSSSFFSHFRARDKAKVAADKFSKGGRRDITQVAANGSVATLFALGYSCAPSAALREICQAGYTGALATATADTWATELGVLNTQPPRLITTGERVAPGTSGGITLFGTAAAGLGALALGSIFWLLERGHKSLSWLPFVALISGLGSSMVDSVLGATVQAMYFCPTCERETEKRVHSCGTKTLPLRGVTWLNNDAVNFLSTLFGSLLAIATHKAMQRS